MKEMEVIIGHYTFLALINRPALSALSAVYRHGRQLGTARHASTDSVKLHVTPAVVKELEWMQALLPLCICELRLPFHTTVVCTDASLDGQGVVTASVPEKSVEQIYGHAELWRFGSETLRKLGPRGQVFQELRGPCVEELKGESWRHTVSSVPALPAQNDKRAEIGASSCASKS